MLFFPFLRILNQPGRLTELAEGASSSLELFYLVRNVAQPAMHVYNLLRQLPVNRVDLGFRLEIEKTHIPSLLRLFLDLLDIVEALDSIRPLQPGAAGSLSTVNTAYFTVPR